MRAQFALAESIIAVSMLLAVSAGVSFTIYSVSIHNAGLEYTALFYDFIRAAHGNSTFSSCLAYANGSCAGILRRIANVYGISYIEIDNGTNEASYGSSAGCIEKKLMCAPVDKSAAYSISCIYACGG